VIQALAHLFEPWKELYSNSTPISTTVTAVHILSLLVAGGLAIAADRTTLRVLRRSPAERGFQLAELHDVHRPVLVALGVLVVSGLLLLTADFATLVVSPAFWVKITLVTCLLANGLILYRTELNLDRAMASHGEAPPRLWSRLRTTSRASLTLWILTAMAGTILTSAA
jgi:hypothetical protein